MEHKSGRNLHVGLIGDGVRRWARSNSVDLKDAYLAAMDHVGLFIDFFFENGANILSVYLLSKENLKRPPRDLEAAVYGETIFLQTVLKELVKKWNCSVVLAGAKDLLPEKYLRAAEELVERPSGEERKIYLLAGYNPVDEINQAISANKEAFVEHLWVKEPVDIVIRTSGERRISNFLPLQIGYAELYFLKKHINDLDINDCKFVFEDFCSSRIRRFGK